MSFPNNEANRKKVLTKVYTSLYKNTINEKNEIKATEKLNYNTLFPEYKDDISILFAQEFNKVGGNFVYCTDETDAYIKFKNIMHNSEWDKIYSREEKILTALNEHQLINNIHISLATADVSITTCDFLIARTGSIAISTSGEGDRLSNVFAPIHVCIAYAKQVVYNVDVALQKFCQHQTKRPSMFSLITGPSKTADIEKTLVKGVHGPEEIFVFFIDQ